MTTRTDTTAILRASWSALDTVAASLTPEQWAAQSLCPDWTAHGVLVHVAAVEQVLTGWKPGSDAPFAGIAPAYAELTAMAPDALLTRFRRAVGERTAELEAMTDDDFATPGVTPVGPGTYGRFMDIRVFDVWVHERDIRVPLGLPGDDSGPAAERSLDEVQSSLGYIVGKKIGLDDGQGIAFDITGPTPRRMLVKVDGRAALTDELPNPDTTLTTDSLTFLLLACGRIDSEAAIGDGRVTWTGDPDIGGRAARNLRFTM